MRNAAHGQTLLLKPSRRNWIGMLVGCLAFTAIAANMALEGDAWGWFGVVIFGTCAVVAGIQFIPGSGHLRLRRDGFEFRSLWRTKSYRWADVANFQTAEFYRKRFVVWDWAPGFEKPRAASLHAKFAGVESGLPDSYGLKPNELATLMNEWRARALGGDADKARKQGAKA